MATKKLNIPYRPDDLLATKLEIPLLGYRIIQRNRLTALLQAGSTRRVTLVTAPAGYGKTTLLVEWLSTNKLADWRVAWVSLDSSDSTPLTFWSYVAAGLQKISPHLHYNPQPILQHESSLQDFTQLNPLINGIAQIPHPVCLVLDNYEAIKDDSIHQAVGYLIEHQPDNLHLILSSRTVPPIPLARLRIQRQLVEINEKELSFTLPEAHAFLKQVMELDLAPEKVTALVEATEGWIAGLQMAGLSMHDRPDFQPMQGRLVDDNRQITTYLIEEVLNQQEPAVRDFLLKTSILTDLSAPLCNALLGRTDSQEMLSRIERANLFVITLDVSQSWYRCHPLFADVLQTYLEQMHPEQVGELHRRACAWLLEHGYAEKAVTHALACGDLEKAAEIVDTCAMQNIIDLDLTSLVQWINRFSDDLLRKRPQLGIYYGLASFLLGQLDLMEPKLQVIEQTLQKLQEDRIPGETEKRIRWEMSVLRAVRDCMQGSFDQGVPKIQRLLKDVPAGDIYFLGFMNHWLAETYDSAGELEAAADRFNQARQFASDKHLLIGLAHSGCGLARIRRKQGRLLEAEREYQTALRFANQSGKDLSLIALAQTGLVEIALERMDSTINDGWIEEILRNYDQIEASALMWDNLTLLSLRLARYCLIHQDLDGARLHFQKSTSNVARWHKSRAYLPSEMIDVQVALWITSGELEAADRPFEKELVESYSTGRPNTAEQAALARIALIRHQPAQALPLLADLEALTQKTGEVGRLIEGLILESLAYQAAGQEALALEHLEQALQSASVEGYTRLFVREGEPLKNLFDRYLEGKASKPTNPGEAYFHNYLQKLSAAFGHPPEVQLPQPPQEPTQATLVTPLQTPLSEREVEVLRLLAAGKSAKEMSATLMISVNTVKTHVKSIYRKLGGHSRRVVFQRADELGIIPHSPKP